MTGTAWKYVFAPIALSLGLGLQIPREATAQISDGVAVPSSQYSDVAAAASIAKQAYIYGYPLITSEVTRVQMTNVDKVEGLKGPMNHIVNVHRYPPADYRGVTAPNADTLYSVAWIDVGAEPWVFSHPDMGKRFFLFPFLSAWSNVISVHGTRTGESPASSYAITGPGWSGTLPQGIKQIKSPTRYVFLLGRTYSTGTEEDYATVNALQAEYRLVRLSDFGAASSVSPVAKVNPDPGFSMSAKVRDVIGAMTVSDYFNMLARLMKDNPPLPQDGPMVAEMAKIGLVPGRPFEMGKLSSAAQQALQEVPKTAYAEIVGHYSRAGRNENGWLYSYPTGRYGTDYLQRALIADVGYGANLPQDAIYPATKVDEAGETLSGKNRYFIHFDKGAFPPAEGFWSITMYDSDWFFVPNKLNRYAFSLRNHPKLNSDGSMDVYIQNDSPGPEREANWLPAAKGNFILMMRLYWPSENPPSIIDGSWTVPPVRLSTQ
jgi:hypothetical protein